MILPYENHEKASFKPDINRHLYCWNFRAINNLLDEAGYKVIENKTLFFPLGYKKLAFASKISLGFYDFLTKCVAFFKNSKELRIVAVKK